MPRTPPDQIFVDMQFPLAGIDLALAFDEQRSAPMVDGRSAKTTVLGINVRAYEPLTGRGRGGSRPGLSRYVAQQVPQTPPLMFNGYPGRIQHVNYIVDPRAEALPGLDYEPFPGLNPTGVPDISTPSIPINGTIVLRNGLDSDTLDYGAGSSPPRYVPDGGSAEQPNRLLRRRKQLTPIITWADPADIAAGTALSGIQLNAAASDPLTFFPLPGVFLYKPVGGKVLKTGQQQKLTTKFYPGDYNRYSSPSDTVRINVNKQQVFIHWDNPSDVTVGTALSATQLNATASDSAMLTVNGAFVYTPPSGTVLSAGNAQALQTVFTPSDTTTYGSATATVHINVTGTGITFIQSNSLLNTVGGLTTLNLSSAVQVGDLIVVVGSVPFPDPPLTLTDSLGTRYVTRGQDSFQIGSGTGMALAYGSASAAGTCAISAYLFATGPAPGKSCLVALVYRGAQGIDSISLGSGSTAALNTGVVPVSASGDLLFSAFVIGFHGEAPAPTLTLGAGLTSRFYTTLIENPSDGGGGSLLIADRIANTSVAATATGSASATWGAAGFSFKKV